MCPKPLQSEADRSVKQFAPRYGEDFHTEELCRKLREAAHHLVREGNKWEDCGEYDIAEEFYAEASRLAQMEADEWGENGRYERRRWEAECYVDQPEVSSEESEPS